MPQKNINLVQARAVAQKFISTYLSENSLQLGSLDENEFTAAMEAITRAMFACWEHGFTTARE